MTPEQAMAGIRAALTEDPALAWGADPDFAIRDPGLVDPVIRRVLDRSFKGQPPTDERGVERIARRCRGSYANLVDQPAGRAEIEAHLRRRYAEPRVGSEDHLLVADHGVTPGALERLGRAGWTVLRSEVVEDGEWCTAEVARALDGLARAYPTVPALDARIRVLDGTRRERWDYRWIRPQARLVVTRETATNFAWLAGAPDLGPFLRGEATLHTRALQRTSLTRKLWGWDPDAPL